jgi:hypothetical protein
MESSDADLQVLDGFFHIEGESIQYTSATIAVAFARERFPTLQARSHQPVSIAVGHRRE